MDVSVIIPTHGRPEKLRTCIAGLARQTLPQDRYEVLVAVDGPDGASVSAAHEAWRGAGGGRDGLTVVELARGGLTRARNALLERVRGGVLLSTNDDVRPEPTFLAEHRAAHAAAADAGVRIVAVGASPWVVHQPDRLFDRLIRETSMVFFYDRMDEELTRDRDAALRRDWGFRHAWGLNMSMHAAAVRAVGGFSVFPCWYGYEDVEMAWKLTGLGPWDGAAAVRYVPAARAWHDHRMEPDDYLKREYTLGYAAPGFAATSPACAAALFGRDVCAPDEAAYSGQFVERERGLVARALPVFRSLAQTPARALTEEAWGAVRGVLYQQHLVLKRWMWRRGLLDFAGNRTAEPARALAELEPA